MLSIILSTQSHITNLLIGHYHQAVNVMGRGITHNHICQNDFWIIGGSSAVSNFISKYVLCNCLKSLPPKQKMSDLPMDCLQEEPPFTYSKVDLFRPFYMKER